MHLDMPQCICWGKEDNLWESALFQPCGPWDQAQVVSLDGSCFYLLSRFLKTFPSFKDVVNILTVIMYMYILSDLGAVSYLEETDLCSFLKMVLKIIIIIYNFYRSQCSCHNSNRRYSFNICLWKWPYRCSGRLTTGRCRSGKLYHLNLYW